MKFLDHRSRSWVLLRRKYPKFVRREDPELLSLLIGGIHRWFDFFGEKPWSELYGYVDADCMKHREQRHHIEGISACVHVFTRAYGPQYQKIIRDIAEDHVAADWRGEIPQMGDYTVWFWKERRGY